MDSKEYFERAERSTKRFHTALIVLFLIISVVLGLLLAASYQQQAESQNLINEQTATLDKLTASGVQRTNQINDLQKHIDCVVTLFQQENRSNLVISNVANCSIAELQTSTNNSSSTAPQKATLPTTAPPTTKSNTDSQPTTQPKNTNPVSDVVCTLSFHLLCL